MKEQALVIIKPDGLVKSLTGDIISKLSNPKRIIVGAKILSVSRELAEEHYGHLKDADFFDELIKYIMGDYHTGRVMALVYEGENVTKDLRDIAGATHPEEAHNESIRGKYGRIHSKTKVFENVVHVSENSSEAEREIKLWFKPGELANCIYPTEEKEVSGKEAVWKK